MNIKIEVTGATEARGVLAGFADRMRDLHPAYKRAGLVVLTDAQGRIRSNGPGWPPTLETSKGSPLQRSGFLFRSLTENADGNIFQDIPDGVRVGTNAKTPDGRYSIGVLMQQGTGVYGPSGQPIHAKPGKFLHFFANGKEFFVKSVKGSPKRPFLFINDSTAKKVANVFVQRVKGEI